MLNAARFFIKTGPIFNTKYRYVITMITIVKGSDIKSHSFTRGSKKEPKFINHTLCNIITTIIPL